MSRKVAESMVIFTVCLALAAQAALACREDVEFVNDTGVDVNDLHIKFNRGVEITDAGAFADNSGEDGQSTHDLDGGTVPAGGSTKIDITVSDGGEGCQHIKIKKWWWTVDGKRQGIIHQGEPESKTSFSAGDASGNGQIRVSIDGSIGVFQTTPGHTPEQSLESFRSFLASFRDNADSNRIYEESLSPRSVDYLGNVTGAPFRELQAELLAQDTTQTIELTNSLDLEFDGELMTWRFVPGAIGYDVVRGDLGLLRESGGEFSIATQSCLAENHPVNAFIDFEPVFPSGFWYLVRTEALLGPQSYDSLGSDQLRERDDQIAVSSGACLP